MHSRFLHAALVAALLLAGVGVAGADQPNSDPQAVPQGKPDPTLTPREITEREQEYLAALKKCEPLAEKERKTCVEGVKQKYGLM